MTHRADESSLNNFHRYPRYTVVLPLTPDNQPSDGASTMDSDHQETDSIISLDESTSMVKSNTTMLVRSGTGDFDHNRFLFETKGTYGIGNAFWGNAATIGGYRSIRDDGDDGYDDGAGVSMSDFMDKPWKPLTRKVKIPAAVLSPYRLLVLLRLIVLGFFITWRIRNPNPDAMWLWGMSIVCEIWFAFSWILDQLPKLNPINRTVDLQTLREKFELPSPANPEGRSDLPGLDVFISTADPDKEPPLVTANTVLSVLATDYPVEKLSIYISDDGASLLTFEAMAEASIFAEIWVPFCRKHDIEPRNPESYFGMKGDPTRNKKRSDFVKDRRWMKREYDEFKIRINGLPASINERLEAFNLRENRRAKINGDMEDPPIATWMADGTHWPGAWYTKTSDHTKADHAGILQVMIKVPEYDHVFGTTAVHDFIDMTNIDLRLPMFVYVSREKRQGFDHNKKAGAMNALVRASAILSNGPFILNFDCDHYIYNSMAIREGMCYMMDRGGDRICYIQFPQRFEGIDPSDRYANHNTVFFDGNMRALDGLQGPMYVGTGCLFRRFALYGFNPPRAIEYTGFYGQYKNPAMEVKAMKEGEDPEKRLLNVPPELDLPNKFGKSMALLESIPICEYQGRPLADHPSIRNGRPPGALIINRQSLDAPTVAEAVSVISCWYEDKTEWGDRVGWIYGSVTEDVVTGYRMHNRGWRSVYCITKRDAFRGTAPINLTDRLHQVLRWATGSVEIFFSRNNAIFASRRLKFLQRVAYLNVGIYPFTSIFLIIYCTLPALSLFTGQFIVQSLNVTFLIYLLIISIALVLLALLEVKWSGIGLEEWWRNEQFWLIGGTSAHLAAVLQGILKVIAGIEISFTLTSKATSEDEDDLYADLYVVKWTSLFIPPLTIIVVNIVAVVVGFSRTVYSEIPEWNKLVGGLFFSFWVLAHMYPFAKGLMGRRGRMPTIIFVWSGLIAITVSLLWLAVTSPIEEVSMSSTVTDLDSENPY
ncbi:cellulose synthase-like D1 [Zostera marina]|uniref:Cellulose synthase-like D1 n=1 Tax=Zostera marina TaxID=29655 RepID=A0A0K9PCZ0_ZOSMR|nr:cellulose synthase-like D1 [Zostera marina]